MPSPFDSIKDPLVREYMERRIRNQDSVDDARDQDKAMQINAGLVDIAGAFANRATGQSAPYFNRWQEMGKAPKMADVEGISMKGASDALRQVGKTKVQEAKEDAAQDDKDFWDNQKIAEYDEKRADKAKERAMTERKNDPNSAESKQAREYLRQVAPNATNMAGFDGMTAAQIEKVAPSLMKSYEAEQERIRPKSSGLPYESKIDPFGNVIVTDKRTGQIVRQGGDASAGADSAGDDILRPRQGETPTQFKARVGNYEKNHQTEKKLSPSDLDKVNDGATAVKLMSNLEPFIDQNASLMGPVAGRIGEANPYNTQAQSFNSKMKAAAQMVGRYLEGGILRKEDEVKYEKMLPTIHDTPDVAKAKLANVREMLAQKRQTYVGALSGQGYDTSGLDDNYGGELNTSRQKNTKPSWAK